jgi:hypothetical protein
MRWWSSRRSACRRSRPAKSRSAWARHQAGQPRGDHDHGLLPRLPRSRRDDGRDQPAGHHQGRSQLSRSTPRCRSTRTRCSAADVSELRDPSQEDPREVQAAEHGLNYVGLDGDIGCIINGAGLAMATMDMIKLRRRRTGELPRHRRRRLAGACSQLVPPRALATSQRQGDPGEHLRRHQPLRLGGQGVVQACQSIEIKVPLIVRLAGTNVEEGRRSSARAACRSSAPTR